MIRNVFRHAGDLGDVIACLPVIRALGGGDIVCGPQDCKNTGRECLRGARFEALRPLLEAQPYIEKVTWSEEPKGFTHDLLNFRDNPQRGENLLDWQARYLGVKASSDPWLQCFRSAVSLDRPVFARSTRYHNPIFPWWVVLAKYKNPLFVGTSEEHTAFQSVLGTNIEYHPTANLLELAQVIAGARMFVGNQSCPFWIAAGLGVNLIQESWPHSPNSQVERSNARYMIRGVFNP